MSDQEKTSITEKRRRGPKPTGWGTLVGVRLQPEMLAWLDEERAKHDPEPTRPEFIRQLIERSKND